MLNYVFVAKLFNELEVYRIVVLGIWGFERRHAVWWCRHVLATASSFAPCMINVWTT